MSELSKRVLTPGWYTAREASARSVATDLACEVEAAESRALAAEKERDALKAELERAREVGSRVGEQYASLACLIHERSGLDDHHPTYSPEWAVEQMAESWAGESAALEQAEKERDEWKAKYEDLELHRASCCDRMETERDAAVAKVAEVERERDSLLLDTNIAVKWRCPECGEEVTPYHHGELRAENRDLREVVEAARKLVRKVDVGAALECFIKASDEDKEAVRSALARLDARDDHWEPAGLRTLGDGMAAAMAGLKPEVWECPDCGERGRHLCSGRQEVVAPPGPVAPPAPTGGLSPEQRAEVPLEVHERGWQWRPTGETSAFAPPFGTIRQCECGCLVAGGPSRCVRCVNAEAGFTQKQRVEVEAIVREVVASDCERGDIAARVPWPYPLTRLAGVMREELRKGGK